MSGPAWSWDPETVTETVKASTAMMTKKLGHEYHGPGEKVMLAKPTVPPSTIKTVGPVTVRAPLSETSANFGAAIAAKAPGKPAASRKRKSDTQDEPTPAAPLIEISDDDPRLRLITDDCNQVRKKIRTFIESGGMKVGEFQKAIGVSPGAYSRFMGQNGAFKGDGCATFDNAFVFFKKRELQGLPLKGPQATKPVKKAKKEEEKGGALDVSGVAPLDGEADGDVEVYDTCDEVRKKIRAYLRKDGVTQAALLRALSACLHDGKKLSAAQLNGFLGKKGPIAGNTSGVFVAGYIFFEKIRIRDGKKKTTMREEMEEVWSKPSYSGKRGVDREHDSSRGVFCFGNEVPTTDKYGRLEFVKR